MRLPGQPSPRQRIFPKTAPIPVVMAMARAPQKVTRIMGLITLAPPAFAPTIPSKARNTNEPTATTGSSRAVGDITRSPNGAAAPTEPLILARLPDHPARQIDVLLPWNWTPRRLAQAA
jgi:hypothetical protein